MKKSLIFRLLVVLASSLIFVRCSCDDDEPLPNPGASSNSLQLYLDNPSPWQYGGVYTITVTGTDGCNTGYQQTYTSTSPLTSVVPPAEGQFRIVVKFELTCCTYGDQYDGCPGMCASGTEDGYPVYQQLHDYRFSGTTRIVCGALTTYWEPVNIHVDQKTDCGC